jgi:hypothetical protein
MAKILQKYNLQETFLRQNFREKERALVKSIFKKKKTATFHFGAELLIRIFTCNLCMNVSNLPKYFKVFISLFEFAITVLFSFNFNFLQYIFKDLEFLKRGN